MPVQNITSDLLMDLSAEQQQLLSGGKRCYRYCSWKCDRWDKNDKHNKWDKG